MNRISARRYYESVACTATLGTTPAVDFKTFQAGIVVLPSGSPITDIDFYVSSASDGTFIHVPAGDISSMSAAKAYAIPSQLRGANYIKMLVNSAGSVELYVEGFI